MVTEFYPKSIFSSLNEKDWNTVINNALFVMDVVTGGDQIPKSIIDYRIYALSHFGSESMVHKLQETIDFLQYHFVIERNKDFVFIHDMPFVIHLCNYIAIAPFIDNKTPHGIRQYNKKVKVYNKFLEALKGFTAYTVKFSVYTTYYDSSNYLSLREE